MSEVQAEPRVQAIGASRAEARAQHGWIMDIYILRRTAMAGGQT